MRNDEYLAELVRAHYDGDDERFDVILGQIISSEQMHGNPRLVERLLSLMAAALRKRQDGERP